MGPLPTLLEEREGRKAVERVFDAESIPLAVIEHRDFWIPLTSLEGLFERAARATGDPMLGFHVGLGMMPDDYGLWAQYSSQATCLGNALKRIVSTLHLHETGTQMRIVPRPGDQVAWEYCYPGVSTSASRHYTNHIVPGLIQFLQGYLGSDWRPSCIEVGYSAPHRTADLETTTEATWVFNRKALAIVFPSAALKIKRPLSPDQESERLVTSVDLEAETSPTCIKTPIDTIRSVISLRLLDGLCDIDGAAKVLRVGCRKLQRQLETEGTTYSSLVSQIRMGRAKCFIEETDASLKRICFELGYSDPAHFSRAFTRHFGYPPSALRKRT